ncbi:hypothetical protein [Mesorhizobium sp.]|uniref:hypothetical protein n=1 Tax=Mesorhizobium sp. TaxID=1871066 RepID=UPI00120D3090|nr:hypothetical protein [Mesorhizobium sp.]TIN83121.1 MAG: hypothetical protein E5X97_27720 [Mesorhizobium sp.]
MTERITIMLGDRIHEYIANVRRSGCPVLVLSVPLSMMIQHEDQAWTNHSQSLIGLQQRGGLAASEAVAILENRKWHKMDDAEANMTLARMTYEYESTMMRYYPSEAA